jgi:NADH:ubiquinone oxidoreductase subunit 4 (subunit M)
MKFPVYFLHFWLPKAHVEAPTRARIILAGLLLKLGTGGFVRLLCLLQGRFCFFFFFLYFLGIFLCRAFCFFQRDIKALAAYSSVNHMSFLLLALLLLSGGRNNGALLIMVSHGFVSVLIFFLIGEFYHLRFSRNIFFLGGVFCGNVVLLFVFLFTWLFNRGVPLSLRFFGEFFCIRACFFFCFFFFFFLFLYFFNSFYYSLFFLLSGFLNKLFFSFFF